MTGYENSELIDALEFWINNPHNTSAKKVCAEKFKRYIEGESRRAEDAATLTARVARESIPHR